MDNPILQTAPPALLSGAVSFIDVLSPPTNVPSREPTAELHCRPRLTHSALAVALLAWSLAPRAWAQEEAPARPLRASPLLQEKIAPEVRNQLPVFVRGDRIEGQADVNAVVEGNAELRRGDTVIRADRLEYTVPEDLAQARGHVRMNRAGNVYEGSALHLRVEAFEGFFSDARYRFLATEGHGESTRADFIDAARSVVHQATYTTCQRDETESWQPDWVLRAERIHLDTEEQVGVAENARLEFLGLSSPAIPRLSFPLSDKRKSGLLPPTIIPVDSINGPTLAVPYYWNIAPNRDATITPMVMARRGLNLGAEFRYLEPSYQGEIGASYLPNDKLAERNRWSYTVRHTGAIDSPLGGLGLGLNLNRVSDDDYWRDFPRMALPGAGRSQLIQRLLPNDASLHWGQGDMSMVARTLRWQTLQDVTAPIIPPYDRLPQLTWRFAPSSLGSSFDASVEVDTTRFHADRLLTGQPNAQRSYTMAQLSRPFLAPWGFVTPRVQVHATHYEFDGALANGARTASRVLPTFSLDSGLVFERETAYLGRAFTQTLEPRAFYTYTPYRDQSLLPVYDTAANDFNFATVFTENAFTGNDRLADNNLLTLGLTSRLLNPTTGAEVLRLGVAQRVRFSDQRVTLPGVAPLDERLSDLLLGAAVNWTPQWATEATVQYNPKDHRSIRSTVGGRYSPGAYRTVSAAYRFQRDMSEQIDVGWQWPINDLWGDKGRDLGPGRGQGGGRWYSVGRLNYSTMERRLVDAVVGIEYDSCCWIGRVVLERLQSGQTQASTRLLLQLEFVGFTRLSLGANPLSSLKQNIPRYQYLREQVSPPSRFSQYD
ncbi:MAG: LPS-assembly protein LptD [Comamonadaceae bacterium]|nr:LPS-assembly protein LptD [Comamonadaceae bacterium]